MNKFDIKELKSKISIASVVEFLRLKGSGELYHCINPDHNDSTPSFSINKAENYFYCFGCHIGGDIIKLYQLYHGIDFKSACSKLASDFQIKIKSKSTLRITTSKVKVTEKRYSSLEKYHFSCKYDQYLFDERAGMSGNDSLALQCIRSERLERNKIIFESLYSYCHQSGISQDVFSYLTDKRKLSEDVIRRAKIFSIQNYRDVNEYMKSIFDIEELRGSGLYKEDNLIFRNTHRLLIPYLEDNQIVYLRARFLDSEGTTKTNKLKYFGLRNDSLNLNSVKRFYNTDILRELRIYDELFICEAELDTLALLSIGLNTIATPGVNSIPVNELNRIKDFNITICFDNDQAGNTATYKLIKAFRGIGKTVNYISLPDDTKDVSDFIIQRYSFKNKICL